MCAVLVKANPIDFMHYGGLPTILKIEVESEYWKVQTTIPENQDQKTKTRKTRQESHYLKQRSAAPYY